MGIGRDEKPFIRSPNTFVPFAFLLGDLASPALTVALLVFVGVFVQGVSMFSVVGIGGFRHAAECHRHALRWTWCP